MKITIEHDNGTREEFRDVSDAYLAVRQLEPMKDRKAGTFAVLAGTRSFSWGGNVRELVKEIRQSEVELQALLVAQREKDGGPR